MSPSTMPFRYPKPLLLCCLAALTPACEPTSPPATQEAPTPPASDDRPRREELQLAPSEGGVKPTSQSPTPRDANTLRKTPPGWSGNATELHTSDACATYEEVLHLEHDGKEGTHKDEWLGGWCPNLPSRPLFWPDPTETKGPPRPPPARKTGRSGSVNGRTG